MSPVYTKRKNGEPFKCAKCGQLMVHDEAYKHWAQNCPKRKQPVEV